MARIDAPKDQPLKDINPSQLSHELGGVGIRMVAGSYVATVDGFDQARFAQIVGAHVADPAWVDAAAKAADVAAEQTSEDADRERIRSVVREELVGVQDQIAAVAKAVGVATVDTTANSVEATPG